MRIFVTGATGLLGSELLPRLIERGWEIYALSRSSHPPTHPQVTWLQGDLFAPPDIRGLDAVLHMAADTTLSPRARQAIMRTNVLGTEAIAYYASSRGARLFHVSTLFVAGDEDQWFGESDYDIGQTFKNPYEESKFLAERAARAAQATIFRPGILVGRYPDGACPFFGAFYKPMLAIVACERLFEQKLGLPRRDDVEQTLHLPKLFLPIRIFGDPNSALALTPVDFAAQTIARLLEDAGPGETYHIVPARVPRNREIAAAVRLALNVGGIEFAPHRRHFPLDMVYNRLIKEILPYLSNQPRFTTSVGGACPPINGQYLKRILTYWRNDGHEFYQRDQRAGSQDAVGRHPEGAARDGALAH